MLAGVEVIVPRSCHGCPAPHRQQRRCWSEWDGRHTDPGKIQFQPGTWLVRASVIKELIAARKPAGGPPPGSPGDRAPGEPAPVLAPATPPVGASQPPAPAATLPGVTVQIRGIPSGQTRDVIKAAVLPLAAASPQVTVDLTIHAEGGISGIPRETLDLTVREGLHQLGLQADVSVTQEG
jgi:hypothetical protein